MSTRRTIVRRAPQRGVYDREVVHEILDAGRIAHVGFVHEDQPYVIPMAYVRDGERLLLHGSGGSRIMRALARGAPACVTVTILDGLVLARSVFHHSMNYRSVVVLGRAVKLEGAEKAAALERLVDGLVPGRSAEARGPNPAELAATMILALPLDELSAKVRTGPPVDDPEDVGLPIWAGTIPCVEVLGDPEPAPDMPAGAPLPGSVRGLIRRAPTP